MLVDEAILRQWLVNSGRRIAVDAIAYLLCALHVRAQLIGLESGDRFNLPLLTQEDLADAVGLTTVHVNHMIQEMRKQGLMELDREQLFIPHVMDLRRSCDFEDDDYFHLRMSDEYSVDRPRRSAVSRDRLEQVAGRADTDLAPVMKRSSPRKGRA